ncbi:MAG: hypothetical protein AAGH82_10565 [Pseudomonadota bacterium]
MQMISNRFGQTFRRNAPAGATNSVDKARLAHAVWLAITVVLMPVVGGIGALISARLAPAFSGSLVIAALVLLAVSAALVRSTLGALEDLETEADMHGDTPNG